MHHKRRRTASKSKMETWPTRRPRWGSALVKPAILGLRRNSVKEGGACAGKGKVKMRPT